MSEAEKQHAALTDECALIDRSWIGLLEVGGEDRQRFLNGLITRNVKVLEPGQGVFGFLTGQKGHVLSDVVVRALKSSMRLETAPGKAREMAEHLGRFVVADRVEIEVVEGVVPLTLAGPDAASLLATLPMTADGTASIESFLGGDAAWRHTSIELGGRRVGLSADGRLGVPAFSFWVGADDAADLRDELLELGFGRGLVSAEHEAVDRVRIEAGVPWFGRDFDAENLPQETGLEGAVDYEKGCYLGQEVVARLHFRGQASRMVRRVTLAGTGELRTGATLFFEGREAGRVTSLAPAVEEGAVAGLAMVGRRALETGTRLETEAGDPVEVLGAPAQD